MAGDGGGGESDAKDPLGVLVVNLLEDGGRQVDAGDRPAALDGGGAGDVGVGGLEVAPGGLEEQVGVGIGGGDPAGRAEHQGLGAAADAGVGAEQDAILVLEEEGAQLLGRVVRIAAADLGQARRGVDVQVRRAVQQLRDELRLLGRVAEVDADEGAD